MTAEEEVIWNTMLELDVSLLQKPQYPHTALIVECHDLPAAQFGLGREQSVHGLGRQQTQRGLEAVKEKLRLHRLSVGIARQSVMLSYVVVGRVTVPKDCFAWLVIPDCVRERRARGRILAIQMANAELARLLQIFVDNQQCCVSSVLKAAR
jgi:hypothetical protein